MGVVYKITKEVVNFILDQKRKDPSMGVRQLSQVSSQAFQKKISKSSVNSILKNAKLSSGVGRRAHSLRTRKFHIPEQKKKQLFSETAPPLVGARRKQGVSHSDNVVKKESFERKDKPRLKPEKKKEAIPSLEVVSARIRPDVASDMASPGVKYDGMGSIFLKAAEWDISDKPVLGRILQNHVKGSALMDLDVAGDILTCMQAFGMKDVGELSSYEKQGLWALLESKKRVDGESLGRILSDIQDPEGMLMDFSIEMDQIFSQISHIKLELENGQILWLDAQLSSLWSKSPGLPMRSPMSKTMTAIAKEVLNNTSPTILCGLPDEGQGTGAFSAFVMAYGNVEGSRINRITVENQDSQELTALTSIPSQKRIFISAMWPWKNEFKGLWGDLQSSKAKQLQYRGRNFSLKEIEGKSAISWPLAKDLGLRLIAVQGVSPEEVNILVTNAPMTKFEMNDIATAYLRRWPNFTQSYNLYAIRHQASQDGDFEENIGVTNRISTDEISTSGLMPTDCDINKIIEAYASMLSRYSQKSFFPAKYYDRDISYMIQSVYNMPGYLFRDKNSLIVNLIKDGQQKEIFKDLEFAVRRANECSIHDHSGRQLFLDFSG